MLHFIAYHNTKRMGQSLQDGEPLRVVTNKSTKGLLNGLVWMIVGEGEPRQYSLGSVINVAEIGDASEEGFKRFGAGPGHVFNPPIPIKDLEWFKELFRVTGHFRNGVQLLKDDAVIAGLTKLAVQAGYTLPEPQHLEPK